MTKMDRSEQLAYLISYLAPGAKIPSSDLDRWSFFRALVNVREPGRVSSEFLEVQDDLLQTEIAEKGITAAQDLPVTGEGVSVWHGDITTLKVDAIVNAANSGMLGCFVPGHHCIDNAIHTFAGVQLRNECAKIMRLQGHPEPVGGAKLTPAFNLPSKYVIHTVGPQIISVPSEEEQQQLASCYTSCFNAAACKNLNSIALCCISTGEFKFPQKDAARIAIQTVSEWLSQAKEPLHVVYCVFTQADMELYTDLLHL